MGKDNIKVVEKITVEEKIAIKELEDKINGMKKDKEAKCKAAKEQLIEMLDVTVDKYRTATGTAEALRVLRLVAGNSTDIQVKAAYQIAEAMASEANRMKSKAEKLSYAKMDQLCDGFYEKEFKPDDSGYWSNIRQLAFEMMRIDLCRNVGGAAEDMVDFIKRVQSEIDATGEELKKLKIKEK